jgi:molybdenum cofactor synthesis domain-containing protein
MTKKIKAFVLTVSDTRNLEDDISGETLVELLTAYGAEVVGRRTATDDLFHLRELLSSLTERGDIDLILTTGGTGFGPRDNTPEATRSVIDREAPGIAEAMRRETSAKTPMSMLSRAIAGIRGQTLIINLPGSPKAVAECFEVIRPVLQHAAELKKGAASH